MWMRSLAHGPFLMAREFEVGSTAVKIHPHPAMKILALRRHHQGFTLVELLVVIAIIAILAAAGFAAANAAIQKAKRTTCLATATSLEQAVINFSTEYGSMPTNQASDEPPFDTSTGTGIDLLKVLLGKETTSPPMNIRGVSFLNVKEGKKVGNRGINGMIYSNNLPVGLYDPWGNGYLVLIDSDADSDETVNPPLVGDDSSSREALQKRVAIWSAGADKKVGGSYKKDDVKTW